MPTNLRLTEANFTRLFGYFYTISHNTDTLVKRTDSGANAFTYPLDTNLVNEVKCIQTDTVFFYTLENNTTANSNNGQLLIKKWNIEDFVLKLKRTYTLNGIASQKYDCNTFSVEHHVTSVDATANSGTSSITLDSTDRLQIGDVLQLGPSTFTGFESQTESVTVLTVSGGGLVGLTTPLQNSYNVGDKASFANKIWFFNKFQPSDVDPVNGSGELYSFDINPLVTTVIPRKAGNEFRAVLASAFIKDNFYGGGARSFLVYANQTNLLFIETEVGNVNFLSVVQSAAQNNQETTSTVIPIHDLAFEGNTIFRLQQKGTFRNGGTLTTETWSDFNYQLATMQRLPTSISLTANPAIISADGVATSTITAILRDQFDSAIAGRLITFTDDDTAGGNPAVLIPTSASTNSQGIATVQFRAGVIPKTVTITSTT